MQFLQTGNALSAKKPHATTPFRTTGSLFSAKQKQLTGQSWRNKLSIGRPNFRGITPKALTTSAASFQLGQCTLNRPLKEDSFNMTQLWKAWMHLFLALKSLRKFGFKSGIKFRCSLNFEQDRQVRGIFRGPGRRSDVGFASKRRALDKSLKPPKEGRS